MKQLFFLSFISTFLLISCNEKASVKEAQPVRENLKLELSEAQKIIELPMHCLSVEYPNKLGQVLSSDEELKAPRELRPVFYGCFDWHSSAHGYWSVVKLVKQFLNWIPTTKLFLCSQRCSLKRM